MVLRSGWAGVRSGSTGGDGGLKSWVEKGAFAESGLWVVQVGCWQQSQEGVLTLKRVPLSGWVKASSGGSGGDEGRGTAENRLRRRANPILNRDKADLQVVVVQESSRCESVWVCVVDVGGERGEE